MRNEHLKHPIELIGFAPLAPLLDVDILPAVGAGNGAAPRFAHSGNDRENLLEGQLAKDEPQGIRDQLIPSPEFAAIPHQSPPKQG